MKKWIMMFSRPGAQETEKDLLRFQDEFLAGRLDPSAIVVRANKEGETGLRDAGDKRVLAEVERDVVDLNGEEKEEEKFDDSSHNCVSISALAIIFPFRHFSITTINFIK